MFLLSHLVLREHFFYPTTLGPLLSSLWFETSQLHLSLEASKFSGDLNLGGALLECMCVCLSVVCLTVLLVSPGLDYLS